MKLDVIILTKMFGALLPAKNVACGTANQTVLDAREARIQILLPERHLT